MVAGRRRCLEVSFGLDGVSSVLTCVGIRDYLSRLIFWMVLPLILILLIVTGTAILPRIKRLVKELSARRASLARRAR